MTAKPFAGSPARTALEADKVRMRAALGIGDKPSLPARLKFIAMNSEFRCVATYRFSQYVAELAEHRNLLALPAKVLYRLLNRWATHVDHTDISAGARIGPGLVLMHRSGVIVGPVSIGDNCVVHHNVTIGQRVARGDQGVPRIGDRVWIGPGCIITGSIAIGDDVTISAGSILSRDVPSGCLVAGNPARVIAKDYDNTDFIGLLPESG